MVGPDSSSHSTDQPRQSWSPEDIALIRAELERILASPAFRQSDRLQRFLRFVVEAALEGKGDDLKESLIGVEVYDRAPDYNPKTEPIVRNEARRLRAKLQQYYESAGDQYRVIIDLPKGAYVPGFSIRPQEPVQVNEQPAQAAAPPTRTLRLPAIIGLAAAAMSAATHIGIVSILVLSGCAGCCSSIEDTQSRACA